MHRRPVVPSGWGHKITPPWVEEERCAFSRPRDWDLKGAARVNAPAKGERGAAAVEMVFFMVIFVMLLFGSFELAREVSIKHALDVGTFRATRYLSLAPDDPTTARSMIQQELDRNVLGGAGSVQMVVSMPTTSFQSEFSVTARVPYQPAVPFIVFAPKVLSVTHSQSIEKYP